MNPTRLIWTVIVGTSGLTVYRAIREKSDPIPQLAGIGTTGAILLLLGEIQPKFAASFAVLLAIVFAVNWDQTPMQMGKIESVIMAPDRMPKANPNATLPDLPTLP